MKLYRTTTHTKLGTFTGFTTRPTLRVRLDNAIHEWKLRRLRLQRSRLFAAWLVIGGTVEVYNNNWARRLARVFFKGAKLREVLRRV